MKVLQRRDRKWYLDRRRIVCSTNDLGTAILCKEQVDYATMQGCLLVMESYEEAFGALMGCYTALLRFYEGFTEPTRWVWLNKGHESLLLEKKFGREAFIGELNRQNYKETRREIRGMGGRYLVLRKDWLIEFRDWLVMSCH